MERNNIVTFKGNPVTLAGNEIKKGDTAPDFAATVKDMTPFKLSGYIGEIIIISAVPSLDTKVCELQTMRFNSEAEKLKAKVITISMDLPFAQSRFCESHNIQNGIVISDYKDREFANKYGLYIKELGLIARSIFVIDKTGKVAYMEIVKETGTHPDYDTAIAEAKKLGA
jgi:thioredoxin-dependent peroxiredoxin